MIKEGGTQEYNGLEKGIQKQNERGTNRGVWGGKVYGISSGLECVGYPLGLSVQRTPVSEENPALQSTE